MRSSINLAVQAAVLIAVLLMRAAQPGWLLIIFVLTVVGPVIVLAQVVVAVFALRSRRLPVAVAVPFAVAAASLLAANLLLADMDDAREFPSPLETVVGPLPDATDVGGPLLLVWAAAIVWVLVAMIVKRAAFRRGPRRAT
ncbi:hypothetical protein ACQEVB_25910 [Pseudonocardia sp. CA-107938]|uniref:hypothetical protein n=1 Tax=Pseudonocardia sp. CA-107938 TaxID=3240021 RepID=UPI003D9082A3